MTDTFPPFRPVPRWVRSWGIATVTVALLLLFVLGGFVTSFRVGMADPIWPTEPWYLLGQDWQKLEFGYLIEHTHRAAGWLVGALTIVFAVGAWYSEPNRALRWFGLAAILITVVAYGEFHRGMTLAETARKAGLTFGEIRIPMMPGIATLIGAALCLIACAIAVAAGSFGRWTRAVAVFGLLAVMVQGLLGGFRVFIEAKLKDDGADYGLLLAAIHGTFGQLTFAILVSAVALCAPRRAGDSLLAADRDRFGTLAVLLPLTVFVQLLWGVWLRHMGSTVAQRLHVLTAFVVTGFAVWLAVRLLTAPDARKKLGFAAWHLLLVVGVQVLLGVEGWMAKYAASVDPYTNAMVPASRMPATASAAIRTGHVVIGTALLASAVVLALRVRRLPLPGTDEPPTSTFAESAVRLGEPVSASWMRSNS